MIKWIELFLTFVREGLHPPISLEFILPHSGTSRTEILNEIDKVAVWHYKQKIAHEEKIQRRFGKESGGIGLDVDDQMANELLSGAAESWEFDEVVQEEVGEIQGEDEDEESEEGSSEESGSGETEYETDSEERHTESESISRAPSQMAKDLRPSRSMNFSHSTPVDRKDFDLPPLPSGASHNIENFRQSQSQSQSRSQTSHARSSTEIPVSPNQNHRLPMTVTRSRTTIARNVSSSSASQLQRRPSDSAIHHKPHSHQFPPPTPSKTQPAPSPAKNGKQKARVKNPKLADYPELKAVPELLPLFVELVSIISSTNQSPD